MPNTQDTVPTFQAILLLLGTAEVFIEFQLNDKERFQTFIQKWVEAEQFRENDPRQFLKLFDEGINIFMALPDYVKNATDRGQLLFRTPILQALYLASSVANRQNPSDHLIKIGRSSAK